MCNARGFIRGVESLSVTIFSDTVEFNPENVIFIPEEKLQGNKVNNVINHKGCFI